MPPVILPGPEFSTSNVDNNVRGMDANVYELEPNIAPLCALSDAMGSVSSDNPKAEWLEDESLPRITTTTGTIASGTFTYPVVLDIFRIGDVVRFSGYGYGLYVTAHSAGSVTGTIIGTQAASTVSGSEMYIVSNANAEGSTLREIEILQLVTQFNYCEIVRTPFGLTTTELGTLHYGGDERARLSKKFGMEHARSIEQIAFFGLRNISGSTRTSGGLLSFITSNVTPDTGGLTVSDWELFLQQGFRYGSETKVAYCSPAVIAAVEGFARNNLRVNDNRADTYGVKMSTYVSGQGEVHLVKHKDWYDSSVYKGYCFLVDMDAVRLRPLRNVGGTRLLKDRQAPDYDGVKDEYRSETCLQVMHERRHALLTGVT